jgi:protein O-GlcNAc transferase
MSAPTSAGETLLRQGFADLSAGRTDAAEAALSAARAELPDHPDVLHLLGLVALKRGDAALAAGLIGAAVQAAERTGQRRGEFHVNLGNALSALGRRDEALAAYREAVVRAPMVPEAHNNFGVAMLEAGDAEAAARSFRTALTLRRDYAEARYNLGNALRDQRRFDAAVASYRQALTLVPAYASAWINLGQALSALGDGQRPFAVLRRAHALDPGRPAVLANAISLQHLVDGIQPAAELALGRRFDRLFARPLADRLGPPANARDPERRLRIGYIGADALRFHTAAVSILPLVQAHDRDRIEIVCYSDLEAADEDEITQRFRAACGVFRVTAGLDDARLADLIRADGIDIAVDMLGYPKGSRLLAMAHRPAPVQVNLLLMGSFGLDAVGWAIGDDALTPVGSERDFAERLDRIDLAFVYDALLPTPAVSPLPAPAAGRITFGSLNQPAKLSPRCLATWAEILRRVPESRLLLKGKAYDDDAVAGRIHTSFDAMGINPARVDLRGWTATQDAHLEVYREIDLGLDPFPYGGVITTCEALWMGIPVVSLRGERVLGRYGDAFLRALGLAELSASDEAGYVEAAVGLALDLPRLAEMRAGLRARMAGSRLCDGPAFARAVEGAYRRMWRAWCAGA